MSELLRVLLTLIGWGIGAALVLLAYRYSYRRWPWEPRR
jgi:hypothetical protein